MTYAPTSIDLSRTPAPAAIETIAFADLRDAFLSRFQAAWDEERTADPELPAWDVGALEANPVARVGGRTWSYLRLLDRARVNDAIRAVLAPLAKGTDLDNIAAGVNVARLAVVPAAANSPAVMESNESLLRRVLLSYDRPSAGSRGRYLYEAWTAWPQMGDAVINGWAVHGRRGDTDIVITGPGGREPTAEEMAIVRAACLSDRVRPEAVSVAVLAAKRNEYAASQVITVPRGPDAELVRLEAEARVRQAADGRTVINGAVPRDLLAGAAFGPNVLAVQHLAPASDIAADPYTVPVLASLSVAVEVREQ